MSRRREIDRRLGSLGDIREVMRAMRNLALIEVHKLSRFVATQRQATANIEAAAIDFLRFYPDLVVPPSRTLHVVVGSERGFCGDFNDALGQALQSRLAAASTAPTNVIAVGRRLWSRIPADLAPVTAVEGASVAEEVGPMLVRVMAAVADVMRRRKEGSPWSLTALYHCPAEREIVAVEFTPFRTGAEGPPPAGYPPLLNVSAAKLLPALAEQYLFAALHGVAYDSLMAENTRRLQQMEEAVKRLDARTEELKLRRNVLRQEEITEEIEVIMLSADASRLRRPEPNPR